jgi:filamentous hemagglutinin
MNKQLYRIIFNKARGLLMVVAENVSVRGKQAGTGNAAGGACSVTARLRPLCFSILLSLGMVGTVGAQIVADPSAPRAQQPTVTSAGNGVPLVNIQTPSSKGVSRNTYSQFDVNQQGAILNNAQTNTPTQLGGYVQGNPNLANGTARVILNEVNSSNPSLLHGYVEVAGNRAQVVIANPSGISCDGCGVINASRVTLTTGTPVMNGGNLEGYRVRKGTVSVSGDGLDASRADYTEIIARGVEVNAGIWAKELKITTGANEVSADHSQVTPIEGDGPAPAFGIDVGALGGMYAGKITLVGTESGVGVRNAGQIGASAGNVTITADGRLDNIGHIAASADLHVDTRVGIDNRGTLYAKGNTKLSTRGNVTNAGTVAAQGDTGIDADNVDSRIGSVIAAGLQGDGTWGSNGDVQVSATGLLTALGVNIAAGDLSLAGAAIDITGSQTGARNISISAGDVDASRADVSATQTLEARATGSMWTDGATISAQRLWIDADMLLNQLGLLLQTGMGTLSVRATTRLDNTGGTIASNGSTNIIADALDNSAGFIGAKGNLTANAAQIINTQGGELISEQAIALTGTSLDNRGGILQALGSVTANLGAGSVDNSGGLMRSDATLDVRAARLDNTGTQGANQGLEGQNVTLTADQINNRGGAIRADHALTLTGSGSLDNTQGLISSMQSVHVQDSNAAARTQSVINDGGMLIAGQWLGIDSANLSGDGQLLSLGDMNLSFTGDFTNTGDVLANGDVTLRTDARLTNDGALEAGGTLTVAADNIDNVGQISAGFTQIEAADTLNNRGLVDGSMTYINAGTVNNLGTGRIYGDHVAIQAGTVNNDVENYMAAVIAARWRMDIGARTLSNREHALIFSSGDMSIGGALDASLLATGSADTINNNSASIEALGNLALSADRINNTNEHFSVGMQKSGSEHIIEYQGSGSPNRYKPGDPYVFIYKDESNHLCTPEIPKCVSGTWNYHGYESWTKYDYTRTTSTSVITGSDPGRITSGEIGRAHV